eukprot:PhF_6_TR21237/c0_g1_i2/m.30702
MTDSPVSTTPVVLHVYRLPGPSILRRLGCGIYHSGVEVHGKEYFYVSVGEGTGVMTCVPTQAISPSDRYTPEEFGYYKCHLLGHTSLTLDEFRKIVLKPFRTRGKLGTEWMGSQYQRLEHNCNHFSQVFLEELRRARPMDSLEKNVPAYINRAARMGQCVPKCLLRWGDSAWKKNKPPKSQQTEVAPMDESTQT